MVRHISRITLLVILALAAGMAAGPKSGKLTIFREDSNIFTGGWIKRDPPTKWTVWVDGRRVARISKARFVTISLAPGEHDVKTNRSEHLPITLKPNARIFVRPGLDRFRGKWLAAEIIQVVPCSRAILAAPKMRPVESKKVFWPGAESEPFPQSCDDASFEPSSRVDPKSGYFGFKTDADLKISSFNDHSPSEEAGLRVGDKIIAFNGKATASMDQLTEAVQATKPGDSVKIIVLREGDAKTFIVIAANRPES